MRVLALDHGTVRVGCALSDPSGTLATPLPVIVEGVSMLQLMRRINRVPDFAIYVTNARRSSGVAMDRRLSAYEATFAPSVKANIVVAVEH